MGDEPVIPLNRPFVSGGELTLVTEAVRSGRLGGDGPFTGRATELLSKLTSVEDVLLTTSCTHALELAAILLEVGPGDEVLLPSFTFPSTASAFVARGAMPVFVDIRPDTYNLDEQLLEAHVTSRTRAIVVVHYGGVGCEMDVIGEVAARHGVAVVEDAAHGLCGEYRGRPLGTFGAFATLSFHETKNVQCGEGGALLIDDAGFVERAVDLRDKGTDRARFARGEVERYGWVDVGSSFLPSDLLAAFLCAQLEAIDRIQADRLATWDRYHAAFADLAERSGILRPTVPAHCRQPAHLYGLLMPDVATRARFVSHLADRSIVSALHYTPLHSSAMGRRLAPDSHCPVSVEVSERLVRLPLFAGMADHEVDRVIDAVLSFPG